MVSVYGPQEPQIVVYADTYRGRQRVLSWPLEGKCSAPVATDSASVSVRQIGCPLLIKLDVLERENAPSFGQHRNRLEYAGGLNGIHRQVVVIANDKRHRKLVAGIAIWA